MTGTRPIMIKTFTIRLLSSQSFVLRFFYVSMIMVLFQCATLSASQKFESGVLKRPDQMALSVSQYRNEWVAIGLSSSLKQVGRWRPRILLDYADYERNRTISSVSFKEKLGQWSMGAVVDRPFKQWKQTEFYGSLGIFHLFAGPEFNAEPNTDLTYTLNGHLYSGEHLSGAGAEVSYPLVSPYLGLGLRSTFSNNKKWFYQLDAGVIFNAEAEVKAKSPDPQNLAFLEQDLQVEIDRYVDELKRNNDYFDDVFPRVSLTIGYSF